MICISQEKMYADVDIRRVVIQADKTPAEFPLSGVGIAGLSNDTKLAPGSMLYCVDTGKTYFLDQTATAWNAWGGD